MNELIKFENTDIMNAYQKSENIVTDVENIIETSQREAYRAVDTILSQRNWLIGCRIAEEEMDGADRAEYGTNIIKQLSKELTAKYGRGYDRITFVFTKSFRRLSTQCVDNLISVFPGRIIEYYCKYRIWMQESGTKKKLMSKHGVSVLCNAILIHNITTECYNHRKRIWLNRKC